MASDSRGGRGVSWAPAESQGELPELAPIHLDLAHFEQKYSVHGVIGRGAFSEVRRACSTAEGVEVAVKFLSVPSKCSAQEQAELAKIIRSEVKAMCRLSSPYIVSVIEAFDLSSSWRVVMEPCEGPDLGTVLRRVGALDLESTRAVSARLAVACLHMQLRGVVHPNLKPGNLIVEGGDLQGARTSVKLADFSFAHSTDDSFGTRYGEAIRRHMAEERERANVHGLVRAALSTLSPTKGSASQYSTPPKARHTPSKLHIEAADPLSPKSKAVRTLFKAVPSAMLYAAPEVYEGRRKLPDTDAFAIGAIMWHCSTGCGPDEDASRLLGPAASAKRLALTCLGRPIPVYRSFADVPVEVRNIIKRLMERDADRRMTVTELCAYRYVAEVPGLVGNPYSEVEI